MNYKTLIFDLDGVICHTDDYHYRAWKLIADKLNIYFDREINNRLRGVSRMESFDIILEKYEGVLSEEDKLSYVTEKNEIYKELLQNMTEEDLSGEVKDTLVTLQERGYILTIGSSSKNAKFILGKLGILNVFEAISDGNNITNSKPDPEVFIKACEMVSQEVEKCLVIEDAEAGIIAGTRAKMHTVAIGEATKCGLSTYNISGFSDLLNICK